MGVILSGAAFQAERRISRTAHAFGYGRSLTRLNCAGFRDDAPQKKYKFKLTYCLWVHSGRFPIPGHVLISLCRIIR